MCPPSRLLSAAARSRLTWLPTPTPARLERSSVSFMTSAENCPPVCTSTTVRQTPLTAIESPCPASAVTTGPRITSRAASARSSLPTTSPSSSTIPVNTPIRVRSVTLYDALMQTRPKNAVRSLWLILTALFAATVLIAGCSSSDQKSSESLPDAATLLKDSNTATRNLKSVHLDLSVQGTLEDLPLKTLAGDLTNVPAVAAQGNTKLTFQGSDVDANFVVADSILYVALSGDSYIDMGPAADVYDIAASLNPDTGL